MTRMTTLRKYREKRDFRTTPEPQGKTPHRKAARANQRLSYFIQKHHARRLHYDFRLELDGALKSWAVPKGPSLDPTDKRLAVHVEDHPLEYGSFEGEIPQGHYGAGTVLVWDKGTWIPHGDPAEGYRKGHLSFDLEGEKLHGRWALVRMGPHSETKENWLLIKENDAAAESGAAAQITELQPGSVLQSGKGPAGKAKKGKKEEESEAASLPGAVQAALPDFFSPQLATLAARAPQGDEWLSEIKFDGYRALCRIANGKAQLFTRKGNDWTDKWEQIANVAQRLPVKQAWLDGEIVAIADDGSISFQQLQNLAPGGRLAYYVFDLLYLNGYDLRGVPLLQRKELLRAVMRKAGDQQQILFSDHFIGDAPGVHAHACMHELEGIIVKRADAPYESSRNRHWLKVKCHLRQEFVIAGYTDPGGSRAAFGALLLGFYDDRGRLRYAGRVGTGFDSATLQALGKQFARLASKQRPFDDLPARDARHVHWLKPELIAEVKFAQWTEAGVIRHAAFVGLRSDKAAREIRREEAIVNPEQTENSTANDDATVAGVRVSHPSRILFPDIGLTKLKLAQYYEAVADAILPHLAQRPLTLVRCPQGSGHPCFFQKHATGAIDDTIERIAVPGGEIYMMVNSRPALIHLVQMGVLEFHTWGASSKHLDKPDRIIFDLDPAPDVAWPQVIEAAQFTRALLSEIGLTSFLKTTGGKGLHVVIPIQPEKSWAEIKAFSRAVAEHMARVFPGRFTAKMAKAQRNGKIFIDYLRNAAEATAVAAYSTRARPGAPVSVPLDWDELSEDLRSDHFTVLNLDERLRTLKRDPWADYFSLKQRINQRLNQRLDTGLYGA